MQPPKKNCKKIAKKNEKNHATFYKKKKKKILTNFSKVVTVLLSASVERVGVSRMRDFCKTYQILRSKNAFRGRPAIQ